MKKAVLEPDTNDNKSNSNRIKVKNLCFRC